MLSVWFTTFHKVNTLVLRPSRWEAKYYQHPGHSPHNSSTHDPPKDSHYFDLYSQQLVLQVSEGLWKERVSLYHNCFLLLNIMLVGFNLVVA